MGISYSDDFGPPEDSGIDEPILGPDAKPALRATLYGEKGEKRLAVGSVGVVSPDGAYSDVVGSLLAYADPLGIWEIEVDPVGTNSTGTVTRDVSLITGLILYLRLVGRRGARAGALGT